ncbi:Protein NLRC3 [Stylophora pistillata]|uniref:Protein NLRC3 n=1 Tax=Stylophora pistillata TaxID=50429 RepID=A0A2B4RL39_STYPI|nr:Protein NLRC3 [Stylophora pistillata]
MECPRKDFGISNVACTSQEDQDNRRLKVNLLSSEWRSSTDGDLSTINRELSIQLAKHSIVEGSVFLPRRSEEDKNNAASHDVEIFEAEKAIGWNPVDWLINVPDGHVMDCVVEHGVTLGRQVPVIRKHHQCKWIQVVHTAPEELGIYKSISQGEQLQKIEVSLCNMADQVISIRPKLTNAYKRYLCRRFGEALKEVLLGSQCVIDSEDPKDWAKEIKAVRQKKSSVRLAETKFLRGKYLEMYSWEAPIRSLVERMHSLIYGTSGMRKTTYCQKLAYDWSLGDIKGVSFPRVDMLVRLTCDIKTNDIEDSIDDQLLSFTIDKKDKEKFFHFIRHNQTRILLVLDGLDELPKKLFKEFLPLIKGRVFQSTYVMLTARHEAGIKVRLHSDAPFEIVGYTKGDADDYIIKYFSSHEKPILAGKLIKEIDKDSQLRELTANALNTALLCLVLLLRLTFQILVDMLVRLTCDIKTNDIEDSIDDQLLSFTIDKKDKEKFFHFIRHNQTRILLVLDGLDELPKKLFKEFLPLIKDTDRILRHSRTILFCELVSCVLRRYCSKKEISLEEQDSVEKYTEQLNQLGELALEALLKDQLTFTLEELKNQSHEFLQLGFLSREASVWKFLITTAASKNDDAGTVDREFSFVVKTIEAIAQCEHPNTGLKPYQIKMAGTLARCFPVDEITASGYDFTLSSRFLFVMFELLNGNCKLNKLTWKLSVSAAAALANVLQTSHTLKHLLLANGSCITSLTRPLQANRTVTHLNTREAGVGDMEVKAPGTVLQSNTTLTHLCLAENKITHIRVEALAEALKSNRVLENLDIGMNYTGDKGAVALSQALESNRALRAWKGSAVKLFSASFMPGVWLFSSFPASHFGDSSAEAFSKALQSRDTQLTRLDLSHTSIHSSCVIILAEALRVNGTLERLDLSLNRIDSLGAVALAQALKTNQTPSPVERTNSEDIQALTQVRAYVTVFVLPRQDHSEV